MIFPPVCQQVLKMAHGMKKTTAGTHKSLLFGQSLTAANDVLRIAFDAQAIFFRRRHQARRLPIWISSGRAIRSRMPWRFRHMDRLQMPNTINATNPMPTRSATSATESYSSQCRLPEGMMFYPCFKWTARIGRQLPTRSSGDLPPPPPAHEGPLWPPCHALVLRHDRNGLARNHREQQKESQLRDF